ncbi:MAG: amidohydrolase family protein [Actinomycetota bacterium]
MRAGSPEWLALVDEDIVEPDLEIIDPHHHLWPPGGGLPYDLDDLHADTTAGHRIVGTVFVECGAAYRDSGPEQLRSVGETDFVAQRAEQGVAAGHPEMLGIVANTDLRRLDLDEILDAHIDAGRGRFRGIRHAIAREDDPALRIPGRAPEGLSEHPDFRRGVRRLGERNLTYDSWHYHHQNAAFRDLAEACPDTTMVLDHFGTPLGVGRFEGRLDEIFEGWKDDIAAIAALPNTVAKIGGLAMPDNGYGWHQQDRPADSDEIVDAHRRWYRHTIECFGPDRCMFESNFPVDRFSINYVTWWNAAKKLCAEDSPDDRAAMLAGTARRIYSL